MRRFWAAAITAAGVVSATAALAGPPFACDGNIYQVQSGQLRIFDPITSTYQNVGPNNASYNATGYNTLDNFAYASQGNNLIRISADGTLENVFNIGFGSFSGDVDFSNNYYLRRNDTQYARISLSTGAVTNVNFSGPNGGPADVAYDQFNGQEYLIGFGQSTMYRYNITTQSKENISIPGLPGGGFGAAWTDSNGRLFTFNNNNGLLYEVTNYYSNAPTFTQVGIGDPSGNNDGFSCSLAPFPNLAPLAFDDDFTTPVNVPVSGNVLVENGNGIDNDPDGGPVTVTTTPLQGPSNGAVTLSANGNFTYTPNPDFFGVDVFRYQITDTAGITARAFVTITIVANPNFTLAKTQTAGPNPVTAPGQTLTYQIVLTNTGDVPLTNVMSSDTLPNGSTAILATPTEAGAATNIPGRLDLNETWTYTTTYSTTQADVDAGAPLINTVRVQTQQTGPARRTATASTPVSQSPAVTFTKTVDQPLIAAPGTLTYTVTADNTGNQTLTGVALTDTLLQNGAPLTLTTGPVLSGDADGDGALDVGEVWTYTLTYAATQAQIDSGADIVNTAALATNELTTQTAVATTSIAQAGSFTVSKTSDTANLSAPGTIAYQILVENTGNTSLLGVTPVDTLTQGATSLALTTGLDLFGDTDGDGQIDPTETWIYSGTYAAGQAQIDDGADIVNAITVTTGNAGAQSSQTVTTITPTPAFTISKDVNTATLTGPGTLSYDIVVTNTGNQSLTGAIFSDTLSQGGPVALTTGPTLSGDTNLNGNLDVGEVWTYAATLAATQAQIDNGGDIVNQVSFDTDQTGPQSATATTTINQTDAITLAKAIAAGQPSSFSAVGDTIAFSYTVTNEGNTTLLGPITIDDDQIGAGLACSAADLAPGQSVSCTQTWTADQADLNAGSVTNSATAADTSGQVSAPQQQTVSAVQSPALAIDKQIVAPVPTTFQSGETLFYEYAVTNTGNVTLLNPITVQDNLTTAICGPLPGGGLQPLAGNPFGPANTIICTASYTLTSTDEQLGSTTNVASAATTFNGALVTSPSDSAIFPVDATPVINLQKTAPGGLTLNAVGQTITYSYRIENVPPPSPAVGAALTELIFINDDKFANPVLCYDPAVDGGSFVPTAVHICTAVYTLTQADLDAGEVTNEATASTTFAPLSPNPVNVVSNIDTVTVPIATAPALTLAKSVSAAPDPAAVGDVITYTITATNTGNQTLNTVTISDPLLGALSCDQPAPVTLGQTAVLTCTGDYTVQQSDIDTQQVGTPAILTNTASGLANTPGGAAITPATASATHPLAAATPSVAVLKELFPNPAASPAYQDVGDTVRYRIRVTNNGNMTLSSIDVTDSLVPGTCTVGPLAPGGTDASCVFDYTVTQADLDRGFIDNTGSAAAQPIDAGAPPVTTDDMLTATGPTFAGALQVIKSGSLDLGGDGIATVGDLISYTITVRNTGNVTLSNVALTDPGADSVSYAAASDSDADNDIDSLAPGGVVTVTATHALTQPDIDTGSFANSATATGADPSGAPITDVSDSASPADGAGGNDPTVTVIPRGAGLTIDKSFTAAGGTGVGDTITYSYLVQNTGNVTLSTITLTDNHTSASGTAPLAISDSGTLATLAPGASATLTASYVITQADVDQGDPITNVVAATGAGPAGTPPVTASDTATVAVDASDPDLDAIKTVRSQTGGAAGDTVVFAITVANTGNVTLSNVTLGDSLFRVNNTPITPTPVAVFESGDAGQPGALDVGEVWTYTVTYQLTQVDIDAGGIRNSATVRATGPDGTPVLDVSDNGAGDGNDPTLVAIAPMPALEAVKTITSTTVAVGGRVTFDITLANTGNVTLTDVAVASDTLTRAGGTPLTLAAGPTFAGANQGSGAGGLQVGETARYTASYILTQADIDAGGIANTATARGTPPVGSPITDVSDDTGAGNDPTVLTIAAAPAITFDKRLTSGGPSFDTVGDVLSYAFEITNVGNVTLTAPYAVADPRITGAGGAITCPAAPIAPGSSLVCTGDYSVTQADIDAGSVTNTATATVGAATPVSDSVTVPAQQTPALSMVKTPENVEPEDFIVGAVVTYTFATTNTGNVTVTDPITITDSLIAPAAITCAPFPAAGLAPGASTTCTGDYTVTADDVQIASVTNLATASDGTTTSPISSAVIPNDGTPALGLAKSLVTVLQPNGDDTGGTTFDEVGDQLSYSLTITNTGQVSFAGDITVIDTYFPDPIACYVPDAANPDLIPGESTMCEAVYVITQADLDAGAVVNEAFARTAFGTIPTIVQSAPDTETTLVDADPMVTLIKGADRLDYAAVGEVVTYDFTLTNTGNQTLRSIAVTDPLIPALTCEAATLAVGGTLTCSAPYVVTQADIDRGSLTNAATASGVDPTGAAIPGATDTVTITGPSVPPTLGLAKTATPTPFGAVGSTITYTFAVTNTSIYTLSDIIVSDVLPGQVTPYTCAVGTLAPGAVDGSCQVVIAVTQAMVDAGSQANTADVTGQDPFGNPATASDTITTAGQPEAPGLRATKLVSVPTTTLGQQITYTLVLENTGNVSIAAVNLSDQMARNDGTPIALDAPFQRISGDTNADNRLNPTEVWTFTAPYTITQDDINEGGFSNLVTATGLTPSGAPVTDTSDNGNDGDGNTVDDATVVSITTDPVLDVIKLVTTSGSLVGDEVVFEIRAANTGNVDIFTASPSDTLSRLDGTDLSADITGPTRISNATDAGDATLSPGEYWSWEVRYALTQDDIDAGGLSNVAAVTGADSGGASVTDISDNGNDNDGNTADDPTLLLIAPTPALEAVKTVTSIGQAAGEEAVFDISVTNTGNVTLTGLSITDTMSNLAGDPVSPLTITVTNGDPDVLTVGQTTVYSVAYVLTQADLDAGGLSNTATASAMTPGGLMLSDVSDNGDDSDGNPFDDPTLALVNVQAAVEATKSAETPNRIGPDLYEVSFTMTVENTGNVTLTELVAEDDLQAFVTPAVLSQVTPPVVTGFTTGGGNAGYNGLSDINMLGSGTSLAPGETGTVLLTVQYNTQTGFPNGVNTLVVSSNETPDQAVAVASVSAVAPADILATKTATPSSATLGDTITYTLTFQNRLTILESNLSVVDALPAGIVYTPGTATVDGVATEPDITGRELRWTGLTLAPDATLTISLQTRLVSGDAGEFVNRTYAVDADGNVISNIATATIARRPEAVFDCTDIIGKVFDDRNQNGYQDGIDIDRAAITVQEYFSDKFERPEGPDGEPGLAGVRLATVNGTLITTDAFGRFSVPCAELPAGIGSNFQLKLDTRTLPSGYHVTTENPRNIRVTAGRMARLNFGATLSNLVEIDLTAAAFNGAAPSAALITWLPQLIAQMEAKPSVLRLTYYRGAEDAGVANARLDALEDAIRQTWAQGDRYRLTIERTMHRVQ